MWDRFETLGQYADGWRQAPLKYFLSLKSGFAIDGAQISPTGQNEVYGGNGSRGRTDDLTHDGPHILIGRQGALCGNVHIVDGSFWATEHALVGTPKVDFQWRWLAEAIRILDLGRFSTATAQPGISAGVIGDVRLAVPPRHRQLAIATYLDRETARIDMLIEEKTQFIALLREKRVAVISQAVTKGLDPSVPMKSSGQDWLGDVPAHWDVRAAARLFNERDERSTTGSEEMMTVSHLTGVTPRSEKVVNMIEAESTIGYKLCQPGDLVVNTLWGWMGAMGSASSTGIVSPAYNVYAPHKAVLDPKYVDAIVRLPIFAKEVTRFSKGVWSSRMRIYPDGFREIRWPLPSIEEQGRIAGHIRVQTTRIDALVTETERSIALLREKRAALITAAVTGQIDIPEAA